MASKTHIINLLWTSNPAMVVASMATVRAESVKTQSTLGRLGQVAGLAFLGVGVAAAVGIGASVKKFADFDAAMTRSLAIMDDVSPKLRDQMEKTAKTVSEKTTYSSTEAASAYYYLASAGYSAVEAQKVLLPVAQFAQAGMMDLGTATSLLSDAQTTLGLRIKDDAVANMENLIHVSDVLVHADNKANASVQEFSEALTNKAGGALRAHNKSIEEGVSVLMAFADRGVKGAEAGYALATMLRDIPRAAVKYSDVWHDMGIEIFDANGNMKHMGVMINELTDALGPMSDSQRAAAFDALGLNRSVRNNINTLMGTGDSILQYNEGMEGMGKVTETVANKQLETLNAKLKILGNKFENVMIKIGEPVAVWIVDKLVPWIENVAIPSLEKFWDKFGEPVASWLIDTFAPWVENTLIPNIQKFIKFVQEQLKPVFDDVSAAIRDDVVPAIEDMVDLFNKIKDSEAVAKIKELFEKLKPIIDPVVEAIGRVAGVVAGLGIISLILGPGIIIIGALILAFSKIKEVVTTVFDTVKEKIGTAIDWVKTKFGEIKDAIQPALDDLGGVWDHIVEEFNHLKDELGTTIDDIRSRFNNLGNIFDNIKGKFQTAFDFISDNLAGFWNRFGPTIQTGISIAWGILQVGFAIIVNIFSNVWNTVTTIVGIAWGFIMNSIHAAIDFISNFIGLALNIIQGDWSGAWENIKGMASAAWEFLKGGIIGAFDSIKAIFFGFIDFVRGIFSPIWAEIKDKAMGAFNALKDALGGIFSGIAGAMGIGINKGIGVINGLIRGLNNIISRLPGLSLSIPEIPLVGGGGAAESDPLQKYGNKMARGGQIPIDPGASGPFITNGARAIVGEGSSAHPEFVIPTDPKFRGRAQALFGQLAGQLNLPAFAAGGVIPDGIGGAISGIGDLASSALGGLGDLAGMFVRGMAKAAFTPLEAVFNSAISGIPWEWGREVLKGGKNVLKDWLFKQDDKLPTQAEATKAAQGRGMGTRSGPLPAGAGPGPGGTYPPLAGRLAQLLAMGKGSIGITGAGGFRSYADQVRMYKNYLAGGNLAAKPGHSNHERGLAADLSGNLALAHRLAPSLGLHFPVRGENWHVQALPGYADGAWNIRKDHTANVHKGEMIVPKKPAEDMRAGRGGTTQVFHINGITDIYQLSKEIGNETAWQNRVAG